MQRYPATSSSGGVSNSAVGGTSARDAGRIDSSFSTSNFSSIPRRTSQLTPYKLKCDKEPLNSRLGPPDFYPQTSNCPEETLTREYLQSGYKEIVEGIEEAKECQLSNIGSFPKPEHIIKCKEALRKRLRAISESRALKRKAGQVYGLPLSGSLLSKPGVFPDQRPCGEDFRRKWIEGLSQQHKRLRSLADHIPHGYRRKSLFEVLIRFNVPLLRATWFIKVTYLNQVRPASTNISTSTPDRAQYARTDLWTKDVIEYLQQLLDEVYSKDGSFAAIYNREQSSQTLLAAAAHQRSESASPSSDIEEPSMLFKWSYMVRLVQWHYAEGLIVPSVIIEWALNQLQEKESYNGLEMLLPVLNAVIESIALSQTYVRIFVDVSIRFSNSLSQADSCMADDSRRYFLLSALAEMLRYLLLAVPDTFVALDCSPVLSCIVPDAYDRNSFVKLHESGINVLSEPRNAYHQHLSFRYALSSLQRRATYLEKVVNPTLHGHGVAKVVQALDKALMDGDFNSAYSALFENISDTAFDGSWIAEVSPCLRSSLKLIDSVSLSFICSVFFLCEWATCDYRDCRTALPRNHKFSGRKDFCQIFLAVLLLKIKMGSILEATQLGSHGQVVNNNENSSGGITVENRSEFRNSKNFYGRRNKVNIFQSPGPLHDIIVCWLDQHDVGKGDGFHRLQVFILELLHHGIFYPQAYLRQLIVSGLMDKNEAPADFERQRRHLRILKQLPGSSLFDVLEEARIADVSLLHEAVRAYSNERRLVLRGNSGGHSGRTKAGNDRFRFGSGQKMDQAPADKVGASPGMQESSKVTNMAWSSIHKHVKTKPRVAELQNAISNLLQFPSSCVVSVDAQPDESQGSLKRPSGSSIVKFDDADGTPGCEECRMAKRPKLGDERSFSLHASPSNRSDDEDVWWVRKGPKSQESFKVEQPLKQTKHVSRGRRKTQSLAQLAAARIESSQGASTSHLCDNKVSCSHHKSGAGSEIPKDADKIKIGLSDITKSLKQLRLLEKRSISIWLLTSVRHLVDENEKAASKMSHCTTAFSVTIDERNSVRWRLGEGELSSILYFLDICSDVHSAVKFLICLLTKDLGGSSLNGHDGRNVMVLQRIKESSICFVGEAFLLSALHRYENVLLATDLLPEALNAAMQRAVTMISSSGRSAGSLAFAYVRNLLKKYRDVASVAKWEKKFRATCDQRLLTELDAGRSVDGESGFSPGVSGGFEDFDEYFRQKLSGRSSRSGPTIKELVQRHIEEAIHHFCGKDKKIFAATTNKGSAFEKRDDGYQTAQDIVSGIMDCMRQNGGASQEVDPSLVASAVSAVVGSVGPAIAKLLDFTGSNYQNSSSTPCSINCIRHILRIHITSLCLLKEAFGERLSRIFEIALAAEASSAISGAFASVKASRPQFQLSPENHDANQNHSNEMTSNSAKVVLGRAAKSAAAVSALVVGAIVHGFASLERMVTAFKLKDGLDVLQFIRSPRSSSNGMSRAFGASRVDHCVEVYIHWFRLLVGNCKTVFDGLVADILGESYTLALSRMQRMLPLNLVFPPAYSIFAMVIWRPYILNSNIATREDIQLYQCLSLAIGDAIKHRPFRDLCLRSTHVLYDLLASDVADAEFAAMLELHSPDKQLKTMAFVPLRARLFLNAIVDSKMPPFTLMQEDGSWISSPSGPRAHAENDIKLLDQLVHVLDTLQPAKFHWQWVELRLLLNEQALIEKIENMSLVEAIRSLSPNAENFALSEKERNFTEIVLTRLLVRPDAVSLYSEVVNLLGKSLEELLFRSATWLLVGPKSVRQRLMNVAAKHKGVSTRPQYWKPWGWSSSVADVPANRGEKRKLEATSIEEGEVVDEGVDVKRSSKASFQRCDMEGFSSSQQYVTERALAELVLLCVDRSSADSRNSFAGELIKQLSNIEQHIATLTVGAVKQAGAVSSGIEVSATKGSNRKGMRGGSPGLGRRPAGVTEIAPPSATGLKASMWLRLQFLLRLLPVICADREASARNMRQMLAAIILRLLGARILYEDADMPLLRAHRTSKREDGSVMAPVAASLDASGDSLFDKFLCVLHALLSNCKPSWLKPRTLSKSTVKSPRDYSSVDREFLENLQGELDRMDLPATIRRRLQAAMPILPSVIPLSISCHPPSLPPMAVASLQPSSPIPGLHQGNSIPNQRTSVPFTRPHASLSGKSKTILSQDLDMEVDPWTLLEDGTGSSTGSSNSSNIGSVSADNSNLKACSWLKGAVRVRRTDLTYIGAMDDDS